MISRWMRIKKWLMGKHFRLNHAYQRARWLVDDCPTLITDGWSSQSRHMCLDSTVQRDCLAVFVGGYGCLTRSLSFRLEEVC